MRLERNMLLHMQHRADDESNVTLEWDGRGGRGGGAGVDVNAQLLEVSLLAPVRWPDVHACMPRERESEREIEGEGSL
jgi:hypothetical protein